MTPQKPSPIQASFWITKQEQISLLIICTLFLIGITTRYFYLKKETATVYTPQHANTEIPTSE